ncbi:MAG: type I DNA topoisomerase [Bacteroidales bacterium]|nr:type I DNA topoisomerase [Bacteroidales bacterium]
MQKNLVIVESPAKAKTIERFLGKDYKVMSSFGHIRDLRKKGFGIDIDHGFQPLYEISPDKKKLVGELSQATGKAETVWLASDEDREGEAIAWHLYDVLGLKEENTRRIVFHEITKNAIEEAVKHPRGIDFNLVNAQQARRVLDRLVGFELSPILWKRIKPSLSAGRVQSVAVRLIVEREREIMHFTPEPYYKVVVTFMLPDADGNMVALKTDYQDKLSGKQAALDLLEKFRSAEFVVENISRKPAKRSPAAPFTTSTLQQEAARQLGFSISQTMRVAQGLYESGKITYMRTDSVHLSSLALGTARAEIEATMGPEYVKTRQYQTRSKGAQEAHEAIRPSYMNVRSIEGTLPERRLYDLIWKRTAASQMADALIEKTTVTIGMAGQEEKLVALGEVVKFDGFLRVYGYRGEDEQNEASISLPPLKKGQKLNLDKAVATEHFSQRPPRYTEASLVHKLEELGIGRPSTYAPIISTIQQRDYIVKANREGEKREYNLLELGKSGKISDKTKTENAGSEKGKLFPTDTGMVVNDFLTEHFPKIMDYNFTASVEQQFDQVAEGKKDWQKLIANFYENFHPQVEEANTYSKEKVGARQLGTDPASGRPVSVRIGRFGPIVQIGTAEDKEKPLFASLKKDQLMENITLEQALDLFKLPRQLGEFEDKAVTVGVGRFGPYIRHDNKFVSLPKSYDPLGITLEDAVRLITDKREADLKKVLRTYPEDAGLTVMNGRFGPYIAKDGVNYKIPKKTDAAMLSYDDCLKLMDSQPRAKSKAAAGKTGKSAAGTARAKASKPASKKAASVRKK